MIVKPPRPAINRAHPLARGLRFACPLFERYTDPGNSSTVKLWRDLVSGVQSTDPNSPAGVGFAPAISKWGHSIERQAATENAVGLQFTPAPFLADFGGAHPWTVSVFVWLNPTKVTTAGVVFALGVSAAGIGYYDAFLDWNKGTSKLIFGRFESSPALNKSITSTATYSTAQALHIVGTFDGSTGRLYVNGAPDGSGDLSGSLSRVPTRTIVGNYFGSGGTAMQPYSWGGQIADARFWGRALSPSEIGALYADPWGLYRPTKMAIRGAQPAVFAPWLPILLGRRATI